MARNFAPPNEDLLSDNGLIKEFKYVWSAVVQVSLQQLFEAEDTGPAGCGPRGPSRRTQRDT